jgi:hypothetical protein
LVKWFAELCYSHDSVDRQFVYKFSLFTNKKQRIFVNMEENKVIHDALQQLKLRTGIAAHVEGLGKGDTDARIRFKYNGKPYFAFIEVKKHIRAHQLPDLNKLKRKYKPLVVVTEYIFPKMKEELRKEGIGYLETNGNVYFKDKDIFLWLEGQKNTYNTKEKTGRAFTKTGLKLVFQFLVNEDLINLTYRHMAVLTHINFGNINIVMNDLKNQGFLLQVTKTHYKLINKKELLQRWMVAYEERLKPALRVGTFRFLKEEDFIHWKRIPLKNMKTWWGAEPAADLFTNYLKPGELTLYTLENKPELIKHYRLIPDEKGNVKVYQKFWYNDEVNDNVVPPLLVYADLMNTADRRCMEAAQKIYEQLLQDKF